MTDLLQSSAVLYGGVVTAQGTPDKTVAVTRGAVTFTDAPRDFAANAALDLLTGNPADATYDRIDLISVNSGGTVVQEVGTAQVGPVLPPASTNVVLAMAYVLAGATAITADQISDARVLIALHHEDIYGAGVDGDIHVNANPFTLIDPSHAGQNVINANTLTRDCNPSSLTIDAGCELKVANYTIACPGVTINQGRISNNGADASGTVGGTTSGLGSTLAGAVSGANGVTGNPGASGGTFGYGGKGGNGGGLIPTSPPQSTSGAGPSSIAYLLANRVYTVASFTFGGFYYGGGGGSGAGDGANKGGGGGEGGKLVAVFSRIIDNTGGTIQVKGGAGGSAPAGNASGGGGGGGGVALTHGVLIGGTIDYSGGGAGAAHGSGTVGHAGASGTAFALPYFA